MSIPNKTEKYLVTRFGYPWLPVVTRPDIPENNIYQLIKLYTHCY